MAVEKSPLEKVYDAIWQMLETSSYFTALVPVGSRVKYDGTVVYQARDQCSEAEDFQVRVVCRRVKPHLQATSNGSFLKTVWVIEVNTTYQGTSPLFNISWAIYRSLLRWEQSLRDGLYWNERQFVNLCRPLAARTKLGDRELNRGIRGWVTVWGGEVDMHFKTSDMEDDQSWE